MKRIAYLVPVLLLISLFYDTIIFTGAVTLSNAWAPIVSGLEPGDSGEQELKSFFSSNRIILLISVGIMFLALTGIVLFIVRWWAVRKGRQVPLLWKLVLVVSGTILGLGLYTYFEATTSLANLKIAAKQVNQDLVDAQGFSGSSDFLEVASSNGIRVLVLGALTMLCGIVGGPRKS